MKTLTRVLFVLTLSLLSACGAVEVKDTKWFMNMRDIAVEFHTLTAQRRYLNETEWYNESLGTICTRPEAFAHWKSLILKLCEEVECDYTLEDTARAMGEAAQEGLEIRKNAGLTHP